MHTVTGPPFGHVFVAFWCVLCTQAEFVVIINQGIDPAPFQVFHACRGFHLRMQGFTGFHLQTCQVFLAACPTFADYALDLSIMCFSPCALHDITFLHTVSYRLTFTVSYLKKAGPLFNIVKKFTFM